MEKKVAVIYLALIVLAFYVVTMLSINGNPFAETTGHATYTQTVSNVTVSIPLDWLNKVLKIEQSSTSRDQPVYVHIGQYSYNASLDGKNWDLAISRLVTKVALTILSSNLADQNSSANWIDTIDRYVTPYAGFYALGFFTALIVVFAFIKIQGRIKRKRQSA